jgi:hypothetical protein
MWFPGFTAPQKKNSQPGADPTNSKMDHQRRHRAHTRLWGMRSSGQHDPEGNSEQHDWASERPINCGFRGFQKMARGSRQLAGRPAGWRVGWLLDGLLAGCWAGCPAPFPFHFFFRGLAVLGQQSRKSSPRRSNKNGHGLSGVCAGWLASGWQASPAAGRWWASCPAARATTRRATQSSMTGRAILGKPRAETHDWAARTSLDYSTSRVENVLGRFVFVLFLLRLIWLICVLNVFFPGAMSFPGWSFFLSISKDD